MINNFNSNIAVEFSINTAIFVQQLSQWSFLNLANKRNIHDGHVWSFNTLEAYSVIFPWWSRRQLETVINNAVKEGLVLKRNYNKHKYDRTMWYALTYKGMSYYKELLTDDFLMSLASTIPQKFEMEAQEVPFTELCNYHFTDRGNGFHTNVTPIPTNNTTKDISNDISTQEPKAPVNTTYTLKEMVLDNPHEIPEQMLSDFEIIRKAKKAKITKTTWDKINKTLTAIHQELRIRPVEAFETMVANNWQSIDVKYFKDNTKRKDSKINDIKYS